MPRSLPRELMLKPPRGQPLLGARRVAWYFLVSQRKPGSWLHLPCWGDRGGGESWKRCQVCSLCCSRSCPQQCALQLTISGWLLPTNSTLVEGKSTVNQEARSLLTKTKDPRQKGPDQATTPGRSPFRKKQFLGVVLR